MRYMLVYPQGLSLQTSKYFVRDFSTTPSFKELDTNISKFPDRLNKYYCQLINSLNPFARGAILRSLGFGRWCVF